MQLALIRLNNTPQSTGGGFDSVFCQENYIYDFLRCGRKFAGHGLPSSTAFDTRPCPPYLPPQPNRPSTTHIIINKCKLMLFELHPPQAPRCCLHGGSCIPPGPDS